MARCNSGALLKLINNEKLTQDTRIRFTVRTDLPDCKKIDTKNKVAFTPDTAAPVYNKYIRPTNRFECGRTGCVTTGTLTTADATSTVTFRALYDATEFVGGVVTFYVKPQTGATYPFAVDFFVASDDAFANANKYSVSLTAAMVGTDGFIPVVIDLTATPTEVIGNGWTAAQTGAYFKIGLTQIAGISSIAIFDEIEDFETEHVVEVGCLSTIGGSYDVEMLTAACQDAMLNPDIQTLEFTLTGTKVTPNYRLLSPMYGKGKRERGFRNQTTERKIEQGTGYGQVILADANQDVCGYITAQLSDSCDVHGASLTILTIPTPTRLDEGHFQAIKNADGTTTLLFHESLVGMDAIITYPQAVDIEETVENPDNLNSVHVSMAVPIKTSDGAEIIDVHDNVFVTSFPTTITNEEATFQFTIAIGRDADGNFVRHQRVIG